MLIYPFRSAIDTNFLEHSPVVERERRERQKHPYNSGRSGNARFHAPKSQTSLEFLEWDKETMVSEILFRDPLGERGKVGWNIYWVTEQLEDRTKYIRLEWSFLYIPHPYGLPSNGLYMLQSKAKSKLFSRECCRSKALPDQEYVFR